MMVVFIYDAANKKIITDANCTARYNGKLMGTNEQLQNTGTLEISANAGYVFQNTQAVYCYLWGESYVFSISSDFKKASIDLSEFQGEFSGLEILTKAETPAQVQLYTFTQNDVDMLTLQNSTATYKGNAVALGTTLYNEGELIVQPNSGYEFKDEESNGFYNLGEWVTLSLNENKTLGTLGLSNFTTSLTSFNIVTVKSDAVDSPVINNTYEIKPRVLRELNSLDLKDRDPTSNDVIKDWAQMIVGAMKFPFKIPDEMKLGQQNIKLASKVLELKAEGISSDEIEIDLGSIFTPSTDNNFLDFNDIATILHLPFLDSINVDPQYVIGHTITIKYLVNLANGDVVANVTSSKVDVNIHSMKSNIGSQVPMVQELGRYLDVINNDGRIVGGDNKVMSPTLEIVKGDTLLKNGAFTIPVKDELILNTLTGFAIVDNIILNVNATQREKDDIIMLLKTGVHFNVS